jgi:hypothetical protein
VARVCQCSQGIRQHTHTGMTCSAAPAAIRRVHLVIKQIGWALAWEGDGVSIDLVHSLIWFGLIQSLGGRMMRV